MLAKQLGRGHTIVTVLCDSGDRYRSRLYDPQWLRQKGLPVPPWLACTRAAYYQLAEPRAARLFPLR